MTKAKTTKRALLSSVLALFLCFAMLIGTTFAWFTDSVTSANNIIKSGNLDIKLEYWKNGAWVDVNGKSDILTNTLWEPGVTEVAYLRVANAGSLALKYQLGINIVSETAGTNVAGESFKLSDYIKFGVVENVNGETGKYDNRDAAVAAVTEAKIISEGYSKASSMTAGQELYLALVVYMPETVGNEANYKTGTTAPQIDLGINVVATQAAAEKDSFGTDYDAGASYFTNVSTAVKVPENATALTSFETDDIKVDVPADVMNALPDDVTSITLGYSDPKTDADNKTVTFESMEFVDQNGEVIDLKDNDKPIDIKFNVGNAFAVGDKVAVYHDGEMIAKVIVDEDKNISYTAYHFCEVVVSMAPSTQVSTLDELKAALAKGEDVILTESLDVKTRDIVVNGVTFDGNGKTVKCVSGMTTHTGITTTGGTIKNVVVNTAGKTIQGIGAGMVYDNALTQDLCLENVTVYAAYYSVIGLADNHKVIVKDSTLYGGISYMEASLIDVTGTHFAIELFTAPQMSVIELSGAAKFTNCSFDEGYCINAESSAKGKNIDFVNCEVNGVKLTAENFAELLIDNIYDGYGTASSKNMKNCIVTVDGVQVVW